MAYEDDFSSIFARKFRRGIGVPGTEDNGYLGGAVGWENGGGRNMDFIPPGPAGGGWQVEGGPVGDMPPWGSGGTPGGLGLPPSQLGGGPGPMPVPDDGPTSWRGPQTGGFHPGGTLLESGGPQGGGGPMPLPFSKGSGGPSNPWDGDMDYLRSLGYYNNAMPTWDEQTKTFKTYQPETPTAEGYEQWKNNNGKNYLEFNGPQGGGGPMPLKQPDTYVSGQGGWRGGVQYTQNGSPVDNKSYDQWGRPIESAPTGGFQGWRNGPWTSPAQPGPAVADGPKRTGGMFPGGTPLESGGPPGGAGPMPVPGGGQPMGGPGSPINGPTNYMGGPQGALRGGPTSRPPGGPQQGGDRTMPNPGGLPQPQEQQPGFNFAQKRGLGGVPQWGGWGNPRNLRNRRF